MTNKKIIYILGCGRSGSTILGFCLGNAERAIDLGEVIDFARLNGHPQGFKKETQNYKFWDNVVESMKQGKNNIDFKHILQLQNRFDKHHSFLILIFLPKILLNMFGLNEYRKYLKIEYDAIFSQNEYEWYIDSSKYPTRLLHLKSIYDNEMVKVIHLIRYPETLMTAFHNPKAQSRTKDFSISLLYYFIINTLSSLVYYFIPDESKIRIVYDRMTQFPAEHMKKIGNKFHMDVDHLVTKINNEMPLHRGFVFNGNRMRKRETVVFRKSEPCPVILPMPYRLIANFFKKMFRL